MKHLKSKWRSTEITPVEISKLSIPHQNPNKIFHEILDDIKGRGMQYPIIYRKYTAESWMQEFNDSCYTENDDGFVWGVVSGRNRIEFANANGYDTIDSLFIHEPLRAKNMDNWFTICDPRNDEQSPPLIHTKGALPDYVKEKERKSMQAQYKHPGFKKK